MGRMTARLLASLDEEAIFKILADQLPQVGIRNGRVAFFEPQDGDPFRMSRLQAGGGDSETLRFETRTFPPRGLYPETEPFHLAILPLVFKEERMGYAAFDADNLDPLATVVRQLASVVKSATLHHTVLELTLTDALTGVFNRRYFDILLEKEVNRARRYDRPLALIMIDIDHFKKYNDAFGHPAGDDALRHAAEIIQSGARRGLDVVTRYGGEEFAVILPETDSSGAYIVAEVLREGIRSGDDFLRTLTVSIGVSALRGDALTVAKLMDRADRALYRAKKQGRNRTVVDEK
jgi:diguanylate cyclase (GGDEF)-like protein